MKIKYLPKAVLLSFAMVCYIPLQNRDEPQSTKCIHVVVKKDFHNRKKNHLSTVKLRFIFLGEVCMCVMLEKLFTIPLLLVHFLPRAFPKNLFSKPCDLFLWKMFMPTFEEPTCVDLYLYVTQ